MDIEKEVQEKGLTFPRVTRESIEAKIKATEFYLWPGTSLTTCLVTMNNGFTVTGESACASPENFNKELGEKLAREHAFNKLWQLEDYLLKERLYQVSQLPQP